MNVSCVVLYFIHLYRLQPLYIYLIYTTRVLWLSHKCKSHRGGSIEYCRFERTTREPGACGLGRYISLSQGRVIYN
jgi:hypothetical protein